MKIQKITLLAASAAVFCAASSYAVSNDALLDLLVEKGVLSETEATDVAAELKEENKGVSFSAKGKETVKLRFNGRMQAQYDALSGEANGADTESTNHFYFRRLFLGAKANLANGIYAETVLDFAGDENPEIAFDKASFGFKFDEMLDAQLGFQKVPFGFEETSSSSKLPTIERSAANRFFADQIDFSSRHMGIHAKGDLGAGFSYAAALVNSAQGEGSKLAGKAESSNDMAFFGRVQWESNGFTTGIDGGSQSNNRKAGGNDVVAFTGYINYKYEGLNLLGEYFAADLDEGQDVDGYSLRASYKIGKFEPVVRYSHLESDDYDIDADELIRRAPTATDVLSSGQSNEIDSLYIGANYYISPAVTFMAGYEMAEAEDDAGNDSKVDGFRARVQILW
jgi:phosphate-selective porin